MPDSRVTPTLRMTGPTRLSTSAPLEARAAWTGGARPLQVAAFNRLTRAAAIELVRSCFTVERWWSALVDARPYADLEALLGVARCAADPLTRDELDLALAGYLGVRVDDWLPVSDTARSGAEESAAVLRERIYEDARTYLTRFGRPLVIRTAGRSTFDVAAHLQRRLGHDAATEDRVRAAALRQIGLLALVRRVGP